MENASHLSYCDDFPYRHIYQSNNEGLIKLLSGDEMLYTNLNCNLSNI